MELISFIVYIFIPGLLFNRMWRNRDTGLGRWLAELILYGSYSLQLFLIGVWPMTYWNLIRYPLVVLFSLVALKSFYNVKRIFTLKFPGVRQIISYLIILSVSWFFMINIFFAVSGSYYPSPPVSLEFPLKGGKYSIVHGGSNELINHHFPVDAQRYALDIVKLNNIGLRANTVNPQELEDFNIYDSIVYSPCDGVIIEAINQYRDLAPPHTDAEHPAGNYLAISKRDSNIVVILAHLKPESLLVGKGHCVEKGEPIARVGNTGNTSEPHLHIHAIENHTGDLLFTSKGVPMIFGGRFLIRNDEVTNVL